MDLERAGKQPENQIKPEQRPRVTDKPIVFREFRLRLG